MNCGVMVILIVQRHVVLANGIAERKLHFCWVGRTVLEGLPNTIDQLLCRPRRTRISPVLLVIVEVRH